jgi:gamma-glutamylcyclotransferase (GGCT)/AIG2-like uncharacterized protein YtfP
MASRSADLRGLFRTVDLVIVFCMSGHETLPIFVYGTLKRGEERAVCWPRPATHIEPAVTSGCLYDLGPYPAMTEGTCQILGELWFIAPEDMQITLRVLDEIECFGNEDVDLYVRKIVSCRILNGETVRAYTYFIANLHEVSTLPAIEPGNDGFCRWNRLTK